MQPLKQCLVEAINHRWFKPIAITTAIVVLITGVALAIIHRHALSHYFTSVINAPEHHTKGIFILAGGSIALVLGLLFGAKKLTEFLFFKSN